MENVRNIRKDKELYYVLPDQLSGGQCVPHDEVAFVVNLYYGDMLGKYLGYLEGISSDIHIYFFTSNPGIYSEINSMIHQCGKTSWNCIFKQNRGRDISALLVSGRYVFRQYGYVCFLHDKKARAGEQQEDTEEWDYSLWQNMASSQLYVDNVLRLFSENENLGLLVPPEPISRNFPLPWSPANWGGNYEHTKELAEELSLKCDISREIAPITYGTAFWCRCVSLQKLFAKGWGFGDFDTEPLAADGTISHAIERILAFVVQDAGYETGTVLSTTYAGRQFMVQQGLLESSFKALEEQAGISCLSDLCHYEQNKYELMRFLVGCRGFFLYGAGNVGRACLRQLQHAGFTPEAILVTDMPGNGLEINGVPVREVKSVTDWDGKKVIVAVNKMDRGQLVNELASRGVEDYMCYKEAWED